MSEMIKGLGSNIVPVFGMIFVGWLVYLNYRDKQIKNREKAALIEKGLDPSLFDAKSKNQRNKNQQSSFKVGLILIGVALGVLFGYVLNAALGIPNFVAYATMILIICGIMLLYFHKLKAD